MLIASHGLAITWHYINSNALSPKAIMIAATKHKRHNRGSIGADVGTGGGASIIGVGVPSATALPTVANGKED